MSAGKKMDPIEARLANIEGMLANLTDALFAPAAELKKKGLKRHALVGNKETARQARIARAARFYGMEVQKWIKLHGERERRLDPGQKPLESTLPKKAKTTKRTK